ncbi:MAG: 16S rRNA (cytidine(1402)-2'-O)-methyltransferase [Defluviitaleaceae bacterium]|nr:16S rRNA (cytidine(1402)-2'-O)-methyltransferase [Defluviitaleaceae bacterium]
MNRGTLYVVATPIGNLSDITPRAVNTLREVDLVAAEDTRRSRALFAHFKLNTPLFSCHAHNEEKKGDFFIRALLEGKDAALISDAGTPCISDPGHRLIRMAVEAGIEVVPVCGASAVVAALSISGFDASRFVFIGFWPRDKKERDEVWLKIKAFGSAAVFYESPIRITKTLSFLSEADAEMRICLCNDLTKKFERIYRGTPNEVIIQLTENPDARKGEYTCVINRGQSAQGQKNNPPEPDEIPALSLEAQLVDLMIKENCDLKTAAALLHALPPKKSKKVIYTAMLRVKSLA